ncbi:MAG: hypothetical protein AAF297_04245 [Planctomycetota bacterium]
MRKNIHVLTAATAVVIAAGASNAQIADLPVGFNFVVNIPGQAPWMLINNLDSLTSVEETEGGLIAISGFAPDVAGTDWDYEFIVSPSDQVDPSSRLLAPIASVSSAFTVTNNNASTQNFTVTTTVAAMVAPGPTEILGSHSGNVGDNPSVGDGATLGTQSGSSLYTARIDGSPVQTLFDDPFSVSAAGFLTNSYGPSNFGFIGGFPVVNASLSIVNEFTLTGLDNAGMTSTFVVRVPTPASASMLVLGALAATRRRR